MSFSTLLILLLLGIGLSYYLGTRRAYTQALNLGGISSLNSLPSYFGYLTAIWFIMPALLLLLVWLMVEDGIIINQVISTLPAHLVPADASAKNLLMNRLYNFSSQANSNDAYYQASQYYHSLLVASQQWMGWSSLLLASICAAIVWSQLFKFANVRVKVETVVKWSLFSCSLIAILTTIGIVLSVLFESIRFFNLVPISEFLFGLHWSPQTSIRADQVASAGSFGSVPLFVGTLQISLMAMCIAVPVGLMSAIYLSEYASPRIRNIFKPLLEILAGIPTVVYGFFAALTVGPALRQLAENMGLAASSESLLAAGLIMGLMIIPFISSLSDDVINAVPQSMRDGSLALGATQSETVRKVVIPAALPGIVSSILLAVSRAIGETMIVVMAAGLAANLTMNPLESVTTVTVQIVTLLVGDQEFDSAKTLAAFALGLMLFLVTLVLNIIAFLVVKRYREQYE